jgi:hypothetical protein
MKVQNLGGTADNKCKCGGGWFDHWERYSGGTPPRICSVFGCMNFAEVGGHVIKNNSFDKDHYIIPLCKRHNNASAGTIFEISDSTPMASANVAETCGKRRG